MTDREEIFEALGETWPRTFVLRTGWASAVSPFLSRCDADLIFNLTESFDGDDTKEMNVVAYVDLLGYHIPAPARTPSFWRRTKRLPKDFCLSRHQDPIFATAYRGRIEHAHDISFPLIVKPDWRTAPSESTWARS